MTEDLIFRMIDFLLSPSGVFIREPLVDEVVDTFEALGLTAAQVCKRIRVFSDKSFSLTIMMAHYTNNDP